MKKTEFFSLLGGLLFVIGLHIAEKNQSVKPRHYHIISATLAVNWDRDRDLWWYDFRDDKGRFGRTLSESRATSGDLVIATRKVSTHIPGETIFTKVQ